MDRLAHQARLGSGPPSGVGSMLAPECNILEAHVKRTDQRHTWRPTRMHRTEKTAKKAMVPMKPSRRKPMGSCVGKASWRV